MVSVLNVLLPIVLSTAIVSHAYHPTDRVDDRGLIAAHPGMNVDSTNTTDDPDTVTPPLLGASLRYGVDTTASPCVDFFQYVNGDWRARTIFGSVTTTPVKNVDVFTDNYQRTQQRLQVILDSARSVASTTKDPTLRVLGIFYESCLSADSLEGRSMRSARTRIAVPDSTRAAQCVQRTVANLGGALGQAFAHDLLVTNAMDRMQQLLDAIRAAVIQRVETNRWMTESEKTLARERLQKLHLRVGMPKEMVDYQPLKLSSDNYMQNRMSIASFDNQQWVNGIGGNIREQWKSSLLTLNAFYNPGDHAIEVPAVMFIPPFFDAKGEDALNFSGIGLVIGHEIFHSIADQLSKLQNPEMKTQIEQFKTFQSSLGTLDGWGTDGTRTFGEDVADLGGVLASYHAWKATIEAQKKPPVALVDGYTPDQRFFIGIGRIWRAKWRRMSFSQEMHGAPFARVNAMVMQMPEFAKAFGCKEGDPMVLAADKRASIW